MRTIYLIFLLFFTINCSTKNEKSQLLNKKTESLFNFYSKFREIDLPKNFNIQTIYLNNEIEISDEIDPIAVKEYIADITNFWKYTTSYNKLNYRYVGRLKETDKYYTFMYFVDDYNTGYKYLPMANDSKLILTTCSKNNMTRISKIILFAYNECEYLITSKISDDLKIKTDHFYHVPKCKPVKVKNDFFLPNKKYPQCIVIKHYSASFTILPNGKIVQEIESEMKQYVAKYNKQNYEYPILIPEIDSLYDADHSLKTAI